jgi:hypothetical protein
MNGFRDYPNDVQTSLYSLMNLQLILVWESGSEEEVPKGNEFVLKYPEHEQKATRYYQHSRLMDISPAVFSMGQ